MWKPIWYWGFSISKFENPKKKKEIKKSAESEHQVPVGPIITKECFFCY
jgi:hypothetical protein